MGPARVQKRFLQILPMLGAALAALSSVATAQESFPNELNSPVDEPQVIVREQHDKVPVRMASQEIQQSTDTLVKLAWDTREATRRRLLSTAQHTPWQMMHGLLGLRHDFLINHDEAAVNGLEWIRTGPMYQNEPWFQKTAHGGRAHPFNKPYWFEGHINQSLAILSQCELPLDTEFGTPDGPITMRDMLKNAQMTVNEKEEVTWTLWALCTYLPPDAKWVNAKGEQWSIERLVQVEVGKPVGGPTSPCGGTHGLYALARARNIYMSTGKPLRGVWYQADQKIKKYIQVSKNNQNSNGTLSSAFFKGKDYKQDFDKRMASTGHQLEFLMMAVDDRTLREPWLRRAVEATANDLMANRKEYVSCSPLYHATNALTIYLERTVPSQRQQNMAQRPNTKTISSTKEIAEKSPSKTGSGSVSSASPGDSATSADARSASPATADSATGSQAGPSGSNLAAEPGESKAPAPVQANGPLTPVPLPDLSMPVVPAKDTGPAAAPAEPPSASTDQPSDMLKKNESSAPVPTKQASESVGNGQSQQTSNVDTVTISAALKSVPTETMKGPISAVPVDGRVNTRGEMIISAEQPGLSGVSDEIIPLLAPIPLKKKLGNSVPSPASREPQATATRSVPVKSQSSAADVTEGAAASGPGQSQTVIMVVPAISAAGVLPPGGNAEASKSASAASTSGEEKNPADRQPEKKPLSEEDDRWKATPAERRRITIRSNPKSSS